jgi:hypothetical protein
MDKRKHFIFVPKKKKTFYFSYKKNILFYFFFSNFAKRRSMRALVTCFIYKGYTTEGVLGFGILKKSSLRQSKTLITKLAAQGFSNHGAYAQWRVCIILPFSIPLSIPISSFSPFNNQHFCFELFQFLISVRVFHLLLYHTRDQHQVGKRSLHKM